MACPEWHTPQRCPGWEPDRTLASLCSARQHGTQELGIAGAMPLAMQRGHGEGSEHPGPNSKQGSNAGVLMS